MTAIEETGTAPVGKSTHLSVDDATRLTLPQLPYADAVLTELDALEDRRGEVR